MPQITIAEQVLSYTEQGSGEVLLLLPDNLHAATAYQDEIDHFSTRYRVVSFDYPGRGQSTRDVRYQDEQDYDLWNFWADYGAHLLLALEVTACHVVGAGFGVLTALHFAGRQAMLHNLTVRSVIADSFLRDLDGRTLHRALDTRAHYYVRRGEWLQQQHGDDWRQVVDADTAFLRRLADRGGYALSAAVLNAIPCPVLLTGNLHDPQTPGIAQEFARLAVLIPDCSLYLAGRSGHRYAEEHPLMWTDPHTFRGVADLFHAKVERKNG